MPPAENLISTYTQPYLQGGLTSCGSAGFCAQVGEVGEVNGYWNEGPGSGAIVVPITNGVAAPAVQVALPANAENGVDGGFNGISCWGADSCLAIGSYADYNGNWEAFAVPIANGDVGTAVEVALPSNALPDSTDSQYAGLNSVSCDPSGACVAVGYYKDASGNTEAMVVPFTGGSAGSAAEVTSPVDNAMSDSTGNQDAGLNSVSCEASGACVAVGDYLDSTGNEQAMVVPVSSAGVPGTSTMLALPSDVTTAGNPSASLDNVSCPASGNCAAIGYYNGVNSGEPMAASISSSGVASPATEVLATLANAASSTDVSANAVGCGSAGCDVVGSFRDTNDSYQSLVIPVSGGASSTTLGTEVQVALPGDAMQDGNGQWSTLSSISCPAAGACLASGGYIADYTGLNLPGIPFPIPGNVNALLVGISGTSVDTGTSAPLPADAAADGRLSYGAGVGCGATGSCAVTAVYLQGYSSTTALANALQCLSYGPAIEGVSLIGGGCNPSGSTVEPYVISAQAPLTITPGDVTTSVTAGVTSVSLDSAAIGGWGPYMWSVANGNTLPDGLSLDPYTGVISGTPQAAGTYQLWMRADSLGDPAQNAEASLTLHVGAGSAPAVTPSTTTNITNNTFTTVTSAKVTSPTSSITPAINKRKPSLIVVRGNLRDHGGAVNVHLRCHSWGRCTGSVELTAKGHVISKASHLSIAAGQTGWVTVHLNATGLKDAASLRKPHHGYPTMIVTVAPKLTVGKGIPNTRPMWVI